MTDPEVRRYLGGPVAPEELAPAVVAITQEANRASRRRLDSAGMTPQAQFAAWQVTYS